MTGEPTSQCSGASAGLACIPNFLVLHVNDSTDDQILFQAACRKAQVPLTWHVVDSAAKGISYFKHLLEQSKRFPVCWPDLVLLDIRMPRGSGFEVLKHIRAQPQLKTLPVVIFTGCEAPALIKEAERLGASSYLMKPHGFDKEVALVRSLYERWSQGWQPPAS